MHKTQKLELQYNKEGKIYSPLNKEIQSRHTRRDYKAEVRLHACK